ncbi:Regulator of chromosome condensation 1/beta-lactamase-inhibitor protein II [Pseudocohnilembus persalinus]|uniref:Regulator of chromosome condensation 1/beta-lactamase-inhibitor protein II n=1 Tax=Pseudocohnilembus persalinus TaxID=266149 RepID=A0A0V0Q788_PSEPJ|nr:Regulator of chromosome condensation 1/beta-lactamase-inhibitor protein II [Pseudocohnilembus persalinus]|eukprot:KRW98093.1 Regulator of chromosome condensation 1/beta-lactamase-inhibitor protein II [Pseudocohnilembus persalinus]
MSYNHIKKVTEQDIKAAQTWVAVKQPCWVQIEIANEQSLFHKGRIIEWDQKSHEILVELKKGQEKKILVTNLYQRTENLNNQTIEDMVSMEILNEPEIINNLQERFFQRKIYSYVGPTLVVMNPFKKVDELYSNEVKLHYFKQIIKERMGLKSLEPHVYGLTASAYINLFENQKKQAIVISGESGAGKTINAKDCMEYITQIAQFEISHDNQNQECNQDGKISIEQKILNCNPILEAFGNAKTVKNDNSSRFGKYVKLIINCESKHIESAQIKNYLLEKARITKLGKKERNFHIFYHFLFGASEEDLQKFGIQKYQNKNDLKIYNYLKQSNTYTVKTIDDESLYKEVIESFNVLGFSQIEIESIFKIISAILFIGNLDFDDTTKTNTEPCSIKQNEEFLNICNLLGINDNEFKSSILIKERKMPGGKIIHSPQDYEKCIEQKDSISKLLYETLFNWIVQKLNQTLKPENEEQEENEQNHIGLLDIYGFEVFEINGFEQFFINYTNEQLAKLYIKYVFEQEMQIFQEEGLQQYLKPCFFSDNQNIIDVLDKPPNGIFPLLDDQCTTSFNTDESFLNKMRQVMKNQQEEIKFPKIGNKFIIIHSAKDVEYTCEGFLSKNMDEIQDSVIQSFKNSENSLVNSFFNDQSENEDSSDNIKQKRKNPKEKFLGYKFKKEMQVLTEELMSSECHFIRCVKSNDDKEQFKFWQKMCLSQIRYLGVLETIKVRKTSYPIRKQYKYFFKRYSFLSDVRTPFQELALQQDQDFKKLSQEAYKSYQLKKEFIKQKKSAVKIQKWWRRYLKRKHTSLMRKEDISFEQSWKQLEEFRLQKMNQAATKIQAYYKGYIYRKKNPEIVRKIKYAGKQKLYNKCATIIQKYWRGYYCRICKYIDQQSQILNGQNDSFNSQDSVGDIIKDNEYQNQIKNPHLLYTPQKQNGQKNKLIQEQPENLTYFDNLHQTILQNKIYLFGFVSDLQFTSDPSEIYLNAEKWSDNLRKIQMKNYHHQNYMQQVQVQEACTMVINSNHKIQGYGLNDSGQLGKINEKTENEIQLDQNEDIYMIAQGRNHTLYINTEGQLYGWGLNDKLQLGIKEQPFIETPTKIPFKSKFKYVACRQNLSYAIDYDGMVYRFGHEKNQIKKTKILYFKPPELPENLPNQLIKKVFIDKIVCGYDFSIFLTNYGGLFSQGNNEVGQLGLQDENYRQNPQQIELNCYITDISCGFKHTLAKSTNGTIYSWGWNDSGQLGQTSINDFLNEPTPIEFAQSRKDSFLQVTCTHSGSFILTDQCKIIFFGTCGKYQNIYDPIEYNYFEQLPQFNEQYFIPVRILGSWSLTASILTVTYAFTKNWNDESGQFLKNKKLMNILTQKWVEKNINTVKPPYIDSMKNVISYLNMKCPDLKIAQQLSKPVPKQKYHQNYNQLLEQRKKQYKERVNVNYNLSSPQLMKYLTNQQRRILQQQQQIIDKEGLEFFDDNNNITNETLDDILQY